MIPVDHYCHIAAQLPPEDINRIYHDTAYGFPVWKDDELFERLILEINQAGLSWSLILKKQKNFRKAFEGFHIPIVAKYQEPDVDRLRQDAGIIRNQLKIRATIHNAQMIEGLQEKYGSFHSWLQANHPLPLDEWVVLLKRHFKFMGSEIINEFLMSTSYLPGAHHPECSVHAQILRQDPPPYYL